MRNSFLLLGIATGLLIGGCAGGLKQNISKPFVEDLRVWPEKYQQNFQSVSTFTGKARMTVESREFSGHVAVNVYWIRPDTLFFHAEGPLGIDVGKIFIGKSRFIIYNQYHNQFISGRLDDPYTAKFLQTQINLQDLKHAILGFVPLPENPIQLIDPGQGVFIQEDPHFQYRFTVNPRNGLLEKWEMRQGNEIILQQEFKNYQHIDGVFIPALIRLTLPQEKERVSLFYKEIHINQPINPRIYSIEVSPKVQQLDLN